ncbi:hypothetical protein NDU88_007702 [Pleurodeles waltl]|uniref:Uncharacterized protein n=1 Tax=Pleurodeles waltl TaxID=8319 RepID=A0AAV7U332_PLEWA|nr:hypothetical protein NDU88_007702 [Pleurodeles waltl]
MKKSTSTWKVTEPKQQLKEPYGSKPKDAAGGKPSESASAPKANQDYRREKPTPIKKSLKDALLNIKAESKEPELQSPATPEPAEEEDCFFDEPDDGQYQEGVFKVVPSDD